MIQIALGAFHVPRFSMILWFAMCKKLRTRSLLLRWGITNSSTCCLCNCDVEEIDHLFFDCPFSASAWKKVLYACKINRTGLSRRREVSWFSRKTKGRGLISKVRRVAFGASVYYLWKEKNSVIFKM